MSDWKERTRPNRLEARFEFSTYDETRDFLDRLSKYSESVNRYPDISFGKNYVNLTLMPLSGEKDAPLTNEDFKFTSEVVKFLN